MLMSTESQCWGSGWRIAERSDGILPFFRLWELIVTRASTENPPPSYRKHAWLPVLALGVYIRVDLKVVIGPVCISGNMYSDALLSVVMPRSKGYPVVSCVCLSEAHPCPSPADGLYARQRYQNSTSAWPPSHWTPIPASAKRAIFMDAVHTLWAKRTQVDNVHLDRMADRARSTTIVEAWKPGEKTHLAR